jgi:hypothetical protein
MEGRKEIRKKERKERRKKERKCDRLLSPTVRGMTSTKTFSV